MCHRFVSTCIMRNVRDECLQSRRMTLRNENTIVIAGGMRGDRVATTESTSSLQLESPTHL